MRRVCSVLESGQVCYGYPSASAEGEAVTQPGDLVRLFQLDMAEHLPQKAAVR